MTRLQLSATFQAANVADVLAACKAPEPETGLVGVERARTLIRQGSVWHGKVRLKNQDFLLDPASSQDVWVAWPRLSVDECKLKAQNIVYDDGRILAVWKSHGLNACPSVYSDVDCLTHGLQKVLDDNAIARGQQPSAYRINVVNRLDRDTAGLQLFARDAEAEAALHALFRTHAISKRYVLIIPRLSGGAPRFVCATTPLRWRMRPEREARTDFMLLGPLSNFVSDPLAGCQNDDSVYLALPRTGRTHQIRIHASQVLQPIRGDTVYGGYPRGSRLRLYCVGYRFAHPYTKARTTISADPRLFA